MASVQFDIVGSGDCPDSPDPLQSFEHLSQHAVVALERWRHWVRSLTMLASGEHRVALRGLVAWYERLCVDGGYANPPPADGMDALFQTEQERSSATAQGLVGARWAIRVAEELANCRQLVSQGDDERAAAVGLSRLEIALHEALERLGPSSDRAVDRCSQFNAVSLGGRCR
jgi:hypothetical protein